MNKISSSMYGVAVGLMLTMSACSTVPTDGASAGFFGAFGGRSGNDPCYTEAKSLEKHKSSMPTFLSEETVTKAVNCISLDVQRMRECLTRQAETTIKSAPNAYLERMQQQNMNREQVMQAVNADASQQSRFARGISADVTRLRQCRADSIEALKADYQSGALSRNEAQSRLDRMKGYVEKDNKLIAELTGQSQENTNFMVGASQELGTYTPPPARQPRSESMGYKCASRTANVRGGPGSSHQVVGQLSAGDCWPYLGDAAGGNWLNIEYQGRPAYVYHTLIVGGGSRAAAPTPAPTPDSPVAEAEMSQRELEDEGQSYSELLAEIDEAEDFVLAER